jgi:hypothetical protein
VIFTLGPRPQVFITSETNCPSLLKVTAREGKGREGKGREGKGREGKGREVGFTIHSRCCDQ